MLICASLCPYGTSRSTRSIISSAARSVKVSARISDGFARFSAISQAMRRVMTVVLPVPAPATISSGPSPWVTALRWRAVRSASSGGWMRRCGRLARVGRRRRQLLEERELVRRRDDRWHFLDGTGWPIHPAVIGDLPDRSRVALDRGLGPAVCGRRAHVAVLDAVAAALERARAPAAYSRTTGTISSGYSPTASR